MTELAEVQMKLSVPKGRRQQNYTYRSIDDILEAVKKILPDGCYITMSDEVVCIGSRNYIQATATFHGTKGDRSCKGIAWEPEKLAAMSAPQITGSCSSYARKSALCGLLMIDDSKDVDSFSAGELGTSGNIPKMATEKQEKALVAHAARVELSEPDTCAYINAKLNEGLSYAKAAEMLRRLEK